MESEFRFKWGSQKSEPKIGIPNLVVSRKDKDLGEVKVILCKQDHGNDAISCKKTRDKIVKSL